jgi:hypothetical protein
MKDTEYKLFIFLFLKNLYGIPQSYSIIMNFIGNLLKVSQKPENISNNQFKNKLKNSNPDFLVYEEFIKEILKLELNEIQTKAIAFYLSRLLYFRILTKENLKKNRTYNSINNKDKNFSKYIGIFDITKRLSIINKNKEELFDMLFEIFLSKFFPKKNLNSNITSQESKKPNIINPNITYKLNNASNKTP